MEVKMEEEERKRPLHIRNLKKEDKTLYNVKSLMWYTRKQMMM